MAVIFKWKTPPQSNELSTEIYLTDGTGDYDATTNVGGYGAPNPDRDNLALVVLAYKKEFDGDSLFMPEVYDPLIVTDFTFKVSTNTQLEATGYLLAKNVAVPVEGDWQYNTSTLTIQQYEDGAWINKSIEDLADTDSTEVPQSVINVPILGFAKIKYNEINALWLDNELAGEDGECDDQEYYSKVMTNIDQRLRQASNQFCQTNYSEFQRIVKSLNSYISDLNI